MEAKMNRVGKDFWLIARALKWYELEWALFPLPDSVKDMPEAEFLEWVRASPLFGVASTKEAYLEMERKTGPRVFLDGFRIFTDDGADRYLAVKGHTTDPFDARRRMYGYGRGLQTWASGYFLLVFKPA